MDPNLTPTPPKRPNLIAINKEIRAQHKHPTTFQATGFPCSPAHLFTTLRFTAQTPLVGSDVYLNRDAEVQHIEIIKKFHRNTAPSIGVTVRKLFEHHQFTRPHFRDPENKISLGSKSPVQSNESYWKVAGIGF